MSTGAAAWLTEPAVVLSGPVHRPVGEDLQLEAGAAVQLSPAQDALQVAKIRQRSALQSALDQTQSLVQTVRQRHVPQCWKSLQIQIDAAEKSSHLCHDEKCARSQTGEERDAHFICDHAHLYWHPYPPRATPGWQLYLLHVSSNFQLWCWLSVVCGLSAVRKITLRSPKTLEHRWEMREHRALAAREVPLTVCLCFSASSDWGPLQSESPHTRTRAPALRCKSLLEFPAVSQNTISCLYSSLRVQSYSSWVHYRWVLDIPAASLKHGDLDTLASVRTAFLASQFHSNYFFWHFYTCIICDIIGTQKTQFLVISILGA